MTSAKQGELITLTVAVLTMNNSIHALSVFIPIKYIHTYTHTFYVCKWPSNSNILNDVDCTMFYHRQTRN